MRSINLLFVTVFLICSMVNSFALEPLKPVDINVSVDPFSSRVKITWKKNPAETNVVAGYNINVWLVEGQSVKVIDNVAANVFEWTSAVIDVSEPLWYSVGTDYGTAGGGNEWDTTGGKTVFLNSIYDQCSKKVTLTWTPYVGWQNGVSNFEIWGSTSLDPTSFIQIADVSNTLSFDHIINNNETYYYYVIAKKDDNLTTSFSNMTSKVVNDPSLPSVMNINTLQNIDNAQSIISFDIELNKNYYDVALIRIVEGEQTVDTISRYSTGGEFSYTDNWKSASNHSYCLVSLDRCNQLYASSDTIKNIIIDANYSNDFVSVSWLKPSDKLYSFFYDLDVYILSKHVNLMQSAIVNSYHDDLLYLTESDGNVICYRVSSKFAGNNGEVNVISNESCVTLEPKVWIPNAINPISTNSENRVFEPRMSLKSPYSIYIYNKNRELIFSDENQGWRGKDNSGDPVKDDTYIYVIEVLYNQNLKRIYKGSVTVVYK